MSTTDRTTQMFIVVFMHSGNKYICMLFLDSMYQNYEVRVNTTLLSVHSYYEVCLSQFVCCAGLVLFFFCFILLTSSMYILHVPNVDSIDNNFVIFDDLGFSVICEK